MTGPAPCHGLRMIASKPSQMRTAKAETMTELHPVGEAATWGQSRVSTVQLPSRTDRDNQGRFLTGNSGGGRPKGAKNKLSETFLETIVDDFSNHGAETVRRLRENDPATYLKLIAWLVPRELILKREQAPDIDPAELTDEEAVALIEAERRRQIIRNAIGPPTDR